MSVVVEAPIAFRDGNAILRFDPLFPGGGLLSIVSGADRSGKNSIVFQSKVDDLVNIETGDERLARQQRRNQEHSGADAASLQASESAAINAGVTGDEDVGCFARSSKAVRGGGGTKRTSSLMAGAGSDSDTGAPESAAPTGPQPFFIHYVVPKKKKLITATFFSRAGKEQLALVREVVEKTLAAVYPQGKKELIVFVSPVSGSGGAKKMWERDVLPLVSLSKHSIRVITTTRQAHAEDFVADLANTVNSSHVCVAVGGDGMMHEAVNGVQRRKQALLERGVDIASAGGVPLLATIPAGSGCGLAKCFNILEPIEAAKALVHLNSTNVDLFRITYVPCFHNYVPTEFEIRAAKKSNKPIPQRHSGMTDVQDPPRYAFLNNCFGVTNEVDKGSEHMRWMGNARFTVKAMQILVDGIPQYRMRVRYRPWVHQETGERLEKTEVGQVLPYKTYPRCNGRDECAHCTSNRKRTRSGENIPGADDSLTPVAPTSSSTKNEEETDWKELAEDRFTLLMLNNLVDAARDMAVAPLAHAGDGSMDIVYSGRLPHDPRPVGRGEFIKIFLGLEGGTHIEDPTVHYIKAAEVEVLPEDGLVMADGELLPTSGVRVKMIPQGVRVVRSL
ncbi:diacylglycerol kinase, putative [Bodo saltans]|uniref:Diacylglycerol kinase, putative n=1 Tax=Bodo saltans TaxID=75058 RepID=A0A0S4JLL4_BODSA|nr:diacylglycerol kinase, putative [Bodo saltans]|eukprot:CUG90283.1 diacylglycerol kinase, putative [Bodo saltans]